MQETQTRIETCVMTEMEMRAMLQFCIYLMISTRVLKYFLKVLKIFFATLQYSSRSCCSVGWAGCRPLSVPGHVTVQRQVLGQAGPGSAREAGSRDAALDQPAAGETTHYTH